MCIEKMSVAGNKMTHNLFCFRKVEENCVLTCKIIMFIKLNLIVMCRSIIISYYHIKIKGAYLPQIIMFIKLNLIVMCRSIIISYYHIKIKGAYLPLFIVGDAPLQYQRDNIQHACVMFFNIIEVCLFFNSHTAR